MDFTYLTKTDPIVDQPEEFVGEMFRHQLTELRACLEYEIGGGKGYPHKEYGGAMLYSRAGVLGDKPGAGKTALVLALCLHQIPQNSPKVIPVTGSGSTVASIAMRDNILDTANVVIAPANVVPQWVDAVARFTPSLQVLVLADKTMVKGWLDEFSDDGRTGAKQFAKEMKRYDLVIISNTRLTEFNKKIHPGHLTEIGFRWKRVFVDEFDKLTKFTLLNNWSTEYLWMVSASRHDFWRRSHLCNQNIPEYNHIVIRCDPEYIEVCQEIGDPRVVLITCMSNMAAIIARDHIWNNYQAQEMFDAGNNKEAFARLGVNKKCGIMAGFRAYHRRMIRRAENARERLVNDQALEINTRTIEMHTERLARLAVTLDEYRQEGCCCACLKQIIFDPMDANCCGALHCPDCMQDEKLGCGWCGKKHPTFIHNNSLAQDAYLPDEMILENNTKGENIMLILDTILARNQNAKILLFNESQETLSNMCEGIQDTYKYRQLKGTPKTVAKILRDFASGALQILFLNSHTAGAGLNLEMATHVICTQRMADNGLESQVIGRAQRFGRSTKLTVIYILGKTERRNDLEANPDLLRVTCDGDLSALSGNRPTKSFGKRS